MARYLISFILLSFSVAVLHSESYKDFYKKIKENNKVIRIGEINKSIAEKNYEKDTILARTQYEKLTAEIAYITALSGYQDTVKAVHNEIFSRLLNTAIKQIEYQITDYEKRVAYLDYEYEKKLHQLSSANSVNMNEALISYRETELDLRQAEWEKTEALRIFLEYTGFEWSEDFLDVVGEYDYKKITEKSWTLQDPAVKKAGLQSELAEYAQKELPDNAAAYARQLAKMEYEKSLLQLEKARADSVLKYRTVIQELGFFTETLRLLKENIKAYEGELQEAAARYKKRIISEKEYVQKKMYSLTLQKNYYENLQKYMASLVSYVIGTDMEFDEVLK